VIILIGNQTSTFQNKIKSRIRPKMESNWITHKCFRPQALFWR